MRILFIGALAIALTQVSCTNAQQPSKTANSQDMVTTASGLQIQYLQHGKGDLPQKGDIVVAHYTGTLLDGTKFDSSVDRGQPFEFPVGMGRVIKGWDEGFSQMKVGDKAILTIPADLAYGARATGKIPANSILKFEVELLGIKPSPKIALDFKERGNGKMPVKGDTVVAHYTGTLLDGTKFDSSVDRGKPFEFKLGMGQVIKGWDDAFAQMKVGDKATITVPPELGYGPRAMGSIPANSTLKFDVELVNVKAAPAAPKPFDTKGLTAQTTSTGLKYYMLQAGTGAKPTKGQSVKVHYSGFLTDGTMFDSSVERGEPIDFQLGVGQVIAGWDEGIALLSKGSKALLEIPYQLAYGEQGMPPVIPAKSTLLFNVELVDFK